jgi:phosphofructokinase-like protein
MTVKRVGMLTGGGDCPGLNPAIKGAVYRLMSDGVECVGITDGWKGMIEGLSIPITLEFAENLHKMGGTALFSSRTNPYKKEGGVDKCVETMKKLRLDALIAMGGEDTLGVATKLYAERQFPVVGVPKTMDNDLSSTDFTFGFDSATTVAVDAAERLIDTGRSHKRIMVLEVMGRHAGWVAVYTGIAAGADWVLTPEETPDVEAMVAHVKKVHARKNTALVVVSEGVVLPGVTSGKEELDEFGHMILKKRGIGEQVAETIKEKTGIDTRAAVIGHIQRGGSPTLFDRMLGLRVGYKAAELVLEGKFGYMAALKGTEVVGVPLKDATGVLKTVDAGWLKLMHVFFK